MKRSSFVFPALAVTAALVVMAAGRTADAQVPPTQAASTQFEASFATPSDFFDRFDYGYSGFNPYRFGTSSTGTGITDWMGDHNMDCAAPTTQREVSLGGDRSKLDYTQMFWHCQPGGDPSKGHLMTSVNTENYNIAWFSPKATFAGLTKVCWDINETSESGRKWTQVVFVDADDARRYAVTVGPEYPDDSDTFRPYRAASGGYDLGFVSPEFSDANGATTSVISGGLDGQHQTLVGFKSSLGLKAEWFQDGQFTTNPFWGASTDTITGITDKAARYKHCLENQPNNTVRLTQDTPDGTRTLDMPGQMPADARRVVFQDDNYNPPKDENYDASMLTWHWDNVQIEAASSAEPEPAPVSSAPSISAAPEAAMGSEGADEVAATGRGSTGDDDRLTLLAVALVVVVAGGVLVLVLVLRSGRSRPTSEDGSPSDGT